MDSTEPRFLELGGGSHPLRATKEWVNMDVRALPGVDIVADFNKPLPLADEAFDGVFSRYLIEHLSWRSVKQFVSEIHRVLKPGGEAALITANLLEQAKVLVNASVWNDDLVSMIFGDQNYERDSWVHNAHHCGFSPESIIRIFKQVGFYSVEIIPIQTVVGPTDMVIEAKKSKARVAVR